MNDLQGSEAFKQLIAALEPWLRQIVIVGGWAHQLYRLHPRAQELEYQPLSTWDADVALPATLPAGDQDIRGRLMAAGFVEEFFGDHRPPATHYSLGDQAPGFYAEFLTPLIGNEYDRSQNRKATKEIGGVASQRLRHIELLLHQPWSVNLEPNGSGLWIQVANPVSFLAQKVLIHKKREREDRAKDILYMHDTLECFGAQLPELRELWLGVVAPKLHARSVLTLSKSAELLFREPSDDIRQAAKISPERALTPEAITDTCRYGFSEVFVDS